MYLETKVKTNLTSIGKLRTAAVAAGLAWCEICLKPESCPCPFGRGTGLGVRATHHARLRRPTNRGCTCVLAFYRRIALRGAAVRADRVHDLCGRNVTRSGCLGILHRISGQSKMRRHCLFAGPGSFRTFFVPAGSSGQASSMRRRTMRGRKGNYHHKAVTGRL